MKKKIISALAAMAISTGSFGALVAVIDSGTDTKHKDLARYIWKNTQENINQIDDDGNGYVDDILGWNFADDNNKVIDYEHAGIYSSTMYRFYELQAKAEMKTITDTDKEWYRSLMKKPGFNQFMNDANIYGGYSHGTHVAGIVEKGSNAEIMAIKLLGTSSKSLRSEIPTVESIEEELGQMAIDGAKKMAKIADYISEKGAVVANGSFGTGYPQVKQMLTKALPSFSSYQVETLAKFFINRLIEENALSVSKAPNTLFVFAAGNDGLNNDIYPSSPTNIRAENVISVAATYGDKRLATFSCYGEETVDIAAPGVNIKSTVPNDNYIIMNGTSQAAPHVARAASMLIDLNKSLSTAQVKEILMSTVDKRDYLKGKVKSGGILNTYRARVASYYMKKYNLSLKRAVYYANRNVKDKGPEHSDESYDKSMDMFDLEIMPTRSLPSPYTIK